MCRHLLELIAFFEIVAAVRLVVALQAEIPAALAWRISVALNFATLALIATLSSAIAP